MTLDEAKEIINRFAHMHPKSIKVLQEFSAYVACARQVIEVGRKENKTNAEILNDESLEVYVRKMVDVLFTLEEHGEIPKIIPAK